MPAASIAEAGDAAACDESRSALSRACGPQTAAELKQVARVTPCVPQAQGDPPNDAHGVTRPTKNLWQIFFVAVLEAHHPHKGRIRKVPVAELDARHA